MVKSLHWKTAIGITILELKSKEKERKKANKKERYMD